MTYYTTGKLWTRRAKSPIGEKGEMGKMGKITESDRERMLLCRDEYEVSH